MHGRLHNSLIIFSALFLMGCDQWFPREEPEDPMGGKVETLESLLAQDLEALADDWPAREDCDGALWAGLACVAGSGVDILEAELGDGRWSRIPGRFCSVPDESRSEISNDMLLGIMSCLQSRGSLQALRRLADYGEEKAWIMGEPSGRVGEVFLKPVNQGYLGRALVSVGGPRRSYSRLPAAYAKPGADYVYHTQTVGLVLDIASTGGANAQQRERIQANADENPGDCLLETVASLYNGRTESAADCWLSPAWSPPSYVRGAPKYVQAHRAYGLKILIDHLKGN